MLVRVAPAIPRPFDGGVDQLEPLEDLAAGRGRGQRQHLPEAVVAHHGDDGLPARPPDVPVGPRVIRVGGHETLLYGEDQVVRCGKRGRRHRWVPPPEPDLQRPYRLAQVGWRLGLIGQTQRFDVFEQAV